jgi:hypothetical protein
MAPPSSTPVLHDLPLEVLTHACQQLGLVDLVRVAATGKRFRHGGLETVELATESPAVTALRELAFPRAELVPRTRSTGCSESWVAYLAHCARQRRCREAPPMAAGSCHSLFVDAAGRLLACGLSSPAGHGEMGSTFLNPTPVAAMAGVRLRSVAAGRGHSLAVGWDGRVYSWGENENGQLGHGDRLERPSPVLVGVCEGVSSVDAAAEYSLAVTQSGAVFSWGQALLHEEGAQAQDSLRPIIVEGFGGVRVLRLCAAACTACAIGQAGEGFSCGSGARGTLGHGNRHNQPSPKHVEVLRLVRVSDVSVANTHVLALAENGLVYSWGCNLRRAVLGNAHVESELLPTPVEALRRRRRLSQLRIGRHRRAVGVGNQE